MTRDNTLPAVCPGDIFCTANPMWLGRAINFVQKVWADDAESKYSHSGIIVNKWGTTMESLWRVENQNIFKAYKGKPVLIGRHMDMTPITFVSGKKNVEPHYKDFYPFYRLFLFMIPPLARNISLGRVVCSELTAKFLVGAGIMSHYKGVNPDFLADMIRQYKKWRIVYEGVF